MKIRADVGLAAQRLRESVASLTEGERVERWVVAWRGDHWWVESGSLSIANAGMGDTASRAVEHIALTASPDAVLAVADLLDAAEALADAVLRPIVNSLGAEIR